MKSVFLTSSRSSRSRRLLFIVLHAILTTGVHVSGFCEVSCRPASRWRACGMTISRETATLLVQHGFVRTSQAFRWLQVPLRASFDLLSKRSQWSFHYGCSCFPAKIKIKISCFLELSFCRAAMVYEKFTSHLWEGVIQVRNELWVQRDIFFTEEQNQIFAVGRVFIIALLPSDDLPPLHLSRPLRALTVEAGLKAEQFLLWCFPCDVLLSHYETIKAGCFLWSVRLKY